jgi:L-seryl-tRNA(Ser) seleniumtransferase
MADFRSIPSVDHILQLSGCARLTQRYGATLTADAVRLTLASLRQSISAGADLWEDQEIVQKAETLLVQWTTPTLMPVINASGVILHTNLGRAPLCASAIKAVADIGRNYSTLEFDRSSGGRGSRHVHAETMLTKLSGAEAALVVNNNAAAVLLALSALANRHKVITAVSQLVEIGGGFRIPDVLKQSGAHLVGIGTTNRVRLSDYEEALAEPAAAVLCTHPSNYKIIGFTEEPSLPDICSTSHQHGVIVIDDLGSGTFLDTAKFGIPHEPSVQEAIRDGADLVCFSGDKLLGGPQAGIVVGRRDLIAKLKKHPLARAIRADKLGLAALSATLLHYLAGDAEHEIPVWQMIAAAPEGLHRRAEQWRAALGQGEVIQGESAVGGGSLPGETLSTWLLALDVPRPDRFLKALLALTVPIAARILNDQVVFDPRTVLEEQEPIFLKEILQCL